MYNATDFTRLFSHTQKFHTIHSAWCTGCGNPPQRIKFGGWYWKELDIESRFNIPADAVIIGMIVEQKPSDTLILISKQKDKVALYQKFGTYIPDEHDISVYRKEGIRDTRFNKDVD